MQVPILDDNSEIEENSSYLLSTLLVCDAVLIWMLLKNAGELPYDDNYGVLFLALIASLLACILILFYFFKARKTLFRNRIITLLFLLSSSPISLFYVCTQYKEIFGVSLTN